MFQKDQKTNLGAHLSLLNKKMSEAPPPIKLPTYKVYIEDPDGNSFSTKLSPQVNTIDDAISQAIANFNRNLNAQLPKDSSLYQLYAAKNGKKDSGLPSFEKTQPLSKVGKERFYLVCLAKQSRMLSNNSLSTIKTIEVDYMGKERGEKGAEKSLFCFCGGW